MSYQIHVCCFCLALTIFTGCVSTSKYNALVSQKSEQDLKLEHYQSLQDQNAALQKEINSLKTQLRSTELVLSDLYLKYEGKNFAPGDQSKSSIPNSNAVPSTKTDKQLEEENKNLISANQSLKDEKQILETKLTTLQNELAASTTDNTKKNKKNKSDNNQHELQKQITTLESVIKQNEQDIEKLKTENSDLRNASSKSAMPSEDNSSDKTNLTASDQIAKLQEENNLLKSNIQTINTSYENTLVLNNQLKAENSSLQDKLNTSGSSSLPANAEGSKSGDEENNKLRKELVRVSEENKRNQNLVKEAEQHFKDLSAEINDKTLKIQSLEKELSSQPKSKENKSSSSSEVNQLKKEIQEKDKQIKLLTQKADLLAKKIGEPDNSKNENDARPVYNSNNETITTEQQEFYDKLNKLKIQNPFVEMQLEFIQGEVKLYIPQSYLFEGETAALKEQGSNLIIKLADQLKNGSKPFNIIAFSSTNTLNKNYESNFRRANTISKLIGISGISMQSYSIGARPYSNQDKLRNLSSGIEISMSAN